jgi:DNA-directed RNA polymerase specialized sigma24 family protein
MQRLQAGNADTCRELLDDTRSGVTAFLRRRLAAGDDIEDVY